MVLRKIFRLSVFLDGEASYIIFGFAITTILLLILLFLVTQLTIVENIQAIALLDFI